MTWVIIAEIFPTAVRAQAMAIATSLLWIACFVLTYTFPILNQSLGAAGTFWLYGIVCLIGYVFLWRQLKETKGKSLEEIEQEWSDEAITP
ncbi:D-xylose-proton symporter [compost metagenome]